MILASERGISMLEVLITMLVFGLGIISAAGMQMTSIRASRHSGLQSTGLQIATDLAERMHGLGMNNPFLGLDYRVGQSPPPVSGERHCRDEHCSPEQLAALDINELKIRVAQALPEGRVAICRDASPWDSARKAYEWDCDSSGPGSAPIVIKVGWRVQALARDPGLDPVLRDAPGIILAVPSSSPGK